MEISLSPHKFLYKRMYKANHVLQHSMFDNKLQKMLNSTNPKFVNHFQTSLSFLHLLYKTFDQQI